MTHAFKEAGDDEYLQECIKCLSSIFQPDAVGNCCLFRTNSNFEHPCLSMIALMGESKEDLAKKVKGRSAVFDIAEALHPHVAKNDGRQDLAVFEINNHSYTNMSHATTIKAIGIHLCFNKSESSPSSFITFRPKYSHYVEVALGDNGTLGKKLSTSNALFSHSLESIHEFISFNVKKKLDAFAVEKARAKKRVARHAAKIEEIKKEQQQQQQQLDKMTTTTTLRDCWRLQRRLDSEEANYDCARLQTIPPQCTIKLVGHGFKVGAESIWLESLATNFQVETSNQKAAEAAAPSLFMRVGDETRLGSISFRADNIYLRSDSLPTSIKLDNFSATCKFTTVVPIIFESANKRHGGGQAWKLGKEFKLKLKKIEPKLTRSGNSMKPPQTLIRFVLEQVIKIVLLQNLKKIIPPEVGTYLKKVKHGGLQFLNGNLVISGPLIQELEAPLLGDNGSSCAARRLLKLTKKQVENVVTFARAFCNEDLSTLAKLSAYVKLKVLQTESMTPILIKIWQLAYDTFTSSDARAAVDIGDLFCRTVATLSRNPVTVKLLMSRLDVSLETQFFLKFLSNWLIRIIYESFGGKSDASGEEEAADTTTAKDESFGVKSDASGEEEAADTTTAKDELLMAIRENVLSIIIPLRRSLLICGNHLEKLFCAARLRISNTNDDELAEQVSAKTPATLSVKCYGLEAMISPQFAASMADFCTK